MYKVKYNSEIVATTDEEKSALGIALTLHDLSNKEHAIFVIKDEINLHFFSRCSD